MPDEEQDKTEELEEEELETAVEDEEDEDEEEDKRTDGQKLYEFLADKFLVTGGRWVELTNGIQDKWNAATDIINDNCVGEVDWNSLQS